MNWTRRASLIVAALSLIVFLYGTIKLARMEELATRPPENGPVIVLEGPQGPVTGHFEPQGRAYAMRLIGCSLVVLVLAGTVYVTARPRSSR